MIVRLPLPERPASSSKNPVSLPCSASFEPLKHTADLAMRTKQDMNMIAHHNKRPQIIESHLETAPERFHDQLSNFGIAQIHRTTTCSVQIAVHPKKCFSSGRLT